MRRLWIPVAVLAIMGCAVTDALGRNVVARAGDHVLTVDWFAETLAETDALLRPDLLEQWAWSWVRYSLFLQAEEFEERITVVLSEQWKDVRLEELTRRKGVRISGNGLDIMRDAAERPVRVLVREPTKVIGTYDGGRLTDVGFVRWLQAWSGGQRIAVNDTSDEALADMAMRAMQSDVLSLDAKEAGVAISQEQYATIVRAFEDRLSSLRRVLKVDSVMARAEGLNARRQVAEGVLVEYKTRTAKNLREVV